MVYSRARDKIKHHNFPLHKSTSLKTGEEERQKSEGRKSREIRSPFVTKAQTWLEIVFARTWTCFIKVRCSARYLVTESHTVTQSPIIRF